MASEQTRRLRPVTRWTIIGVAVALLVGAVIGAVSHPHATIPFALLAFVGIAVLLLLRDARVELTDHHVLVQNMVRVYALPLAGVRRHVTDARGGVSLVVYFHPDYPVYDGRRLPHGWRAQHQRRRMRQIRVFALSHDDAMVREILDRGNAERERIEGTP